MPTVGATGVVVPVFANAPPPPPPDDAVTGVLADEVAAAGACGVDFVGWLGLGVGGVVITGGGFSGGGCTGGALGESACAGVIETTWTSGTVHAAATPTTAPRLSRSRRLTLAGTAGLSN
jgi:hypothetical protein